MKRLLNWYQTSPYLTDQQDAVFVTSFWLPPLWVAVIRLTLFCYCATVLISNLTANVLHGAGWSWAAYFTTLTYFGICCYYGVAGYNSLRYLMCSNSVKWMLALQWVLYELFTCFAPLVTLVYWAILYPSQGPFDSRIDMWMGVSMHGVNTLLMLLEVFVLSRCPYYMDGLAHWLIAMAVLCLYLALVYLMVGVYGFYVYPFFETKYFGAGGVAAVCLLIADVVAVVWIIQCLVHRWRDGKIKARAAKV